MNLPNRITLIRVIMVPVFAVLMLLCPRFPFLKWVALAVFVLASLTDMVDGKLARSRGEITNFGKFMDPLADKILVNSALICLTAMGKIPAWMVIIIVSRDFVISGYRLVAAEKGTVIAANYWGKFKTTSQMIMICLVIGDLPYPAYQMLAVAFQWIAVILTIISLGVYIVQNKGVLQEE